MSIITVKGLSKYWGAELLFQGVEFMLNPGEKMALLGRNGTGKTTLMQILLGKMEHDDGMVVKAGGLRLAYLSQDPELVPENTVLIEAQRALTHISELERKLRACEREMAEAGGRLATLMEQYGDLTAQYEAAGGYDARTRVLTVLNGLGFTGQDLDKPVAILSGGQKVRLGLAKVLLSEPDLMLLDEPTNHLDLEATEWLENYFQNMRAAAILVSHDRYFLDKVISKVYELDQRTGEIYHGNYSFYVDEKKRRAEAAMLAFERQQEEYRKLEAFYLKWRLTPSRKDQAMSRKKKLDKMELMDRPRNNQKSVNMRWQNARETGEDVLEVRVLSKQYGDKTLFSGVSLYAYKGDKIALVGPNGVGKTTLLKIIHELLTPTVGTFRWGKGVKRGYFSQDLDDLDPSRTCFEEMLAIEGFDNFMARSLLGRFLFSGQDAEKRIATCSGGERNRLILAKLVVSGANVLLLDEPTNHLDIAAKEVLQEALEAFAGTIVLISHDRYFVDRVANKVWEFSSEGVTPYEGNYSDYKAEKARREALKAAEQVEQTKSVAERIRGQKSSELRQRQEERQRAKAIAELENKITALEQEKAALEQQLATEQTYRDDGGRELVSRYRSLLEELTRQYLIWDHLVSS